MATRQLGRWLRSSSVKIYAEGARMYEIAIAEPDSCEYVKKPNIRRRRRKMYRRLRYGFVPGVAPLCMDSNDPQVVEWAFRKRVLRKVPDINMAKLKKFELFVRNFLQQRVNRVTIMGFEEWLATTSYNDKRKEELRAANAELHGGRPDARRVRRNKCFVKSECYGSYKAARMIMSRVDLFKAWSGPIIKSIENEVYKFHYFVKHMTQDDRKVAVQNLKKIGYRFFITDYTAYEASFKPAIIRACEGQLYRHCLNYSDDANFLVDVLAGKNKLTTGIGVTSTVRGRRMSGEMCTSLGNGWTNLMLFLFFCSENGLQGDGLFEGDDGIAAVNGQIPSSDYESLGFTIKMEEVSDPCKASFCGLVFGEDGTVIREPMRFYQKFGWTHSFIHGGDRLMDSLLHAKSLSALYETPDCPLVSEGAYYCLMKTCYTRPRFVDDGYHKPPPSSFIPTSPNISFETRILFEEMYGIGVHEQLYYENQIKMGNFEVLNGLSWHPDILDYAVRFVVED